MRNPESGCKGNYGFVCAIGVPRELPEPLIRLQPCLFNPPVNPARGFAVKGGLKGAARAARGFPGPSGANRPPGLWRVPGPCRVRHGKRAEPFGPPFARSGRTDHPARDFVAFRAVIPRAAAPFLTNRSDDALKQRSSQVFSPASSPFPRVHSDHRARIDRICAKLAMPGLSP